MLIYYHVMINCTSCTSLCNYWNLQCSLPSIYISLSKTHELYAHELSSHSRNWRYSDRFGNFNCFNCVFLVIYLKILNTVESRDCKALWLNIVAQILVLFVAIGTNKQIWFFFFPENPCLKQKHGRGGGKNWFRKRQDWLALGSVFRTLIPVISPNVLRFCTIQGMYKKRRPKRQTQKERHQIHTIASNNDWSRHKCKNQNFVSPRHPKWWKGKRCHQSTTFKYMLNVI